MTNTPMTSREAFEKKFKDEFDLSQVELTGKLGIRYRYTETNSAWKAWQACEQQNQAVIKALEDKIKLLEGK